MEQLVDEPIPQLMPINNEPIEQDAQGQNDPEPEVIQHLPPNADLLADEILEEDQDAVLAMDDLTDQSEGEAPPPPVR